ncbi:hypothetical protein HCN44_007997 [Aphidius gifuensis]|uniref:Inositol-pentakisphosphate 2-kinase n=1 Tax=Aphidius gifuensis TaxID=684658 RepID=A0A834XLC9_APHGI|nr:inositol-pentakisphosphate 2-kinase [Aphidius gifuensis]KAF7989323.1 hypothetical protein HCN44_007997 [Aphidius gifuensis]
MKDDDAVVVIDTRGCDDHDDDDNCLNQLEHRQINQNELDGYVYRGEGNANLVISLPSTRSVLRFRKLTLDYDDENHNDNYKKKINFEMKFYNKFIKKHMNGFSSVGELIYCPTNIIDDWNIKVEGLRPEQRKNKYIYENIAMKLPDYSLLPEYLDDNLTRKSNYCIEIKPKQGFVPEGDRFIEKCPYCLTQFYKLAVEKIKETSKYCPCDLFSGDEKRMKKAIFNLVDSPQNNLILFKDGTRIWGDGYHRDELKRLLTECFSSDDKVEDKLCNLIIKALLRPLSKPSIFLNNNNSLKKYHNNLFEYYNINLTKFNNFIENKKCNFQYNYLQEGCVLDKLYKLQKLHDTNLYEIYNIYQKYSNINNVNLYFDNNVNDDIIRLRNYLLFSTARDCSILFSFRKIDLCDLSKYPASNVISSQDQSHHFVFNIGVTDLDPKNLESIKKHHQQFINSINAINIIN